jgi:hypothetical protein
VDEGPLGEAVVKIKKLGVLSLNLLPVISKSEVVNNARSSDLAVPVKGSTIVPNLATTSVLKTLKIDKQVRIQTIIGTCLR